MLSSCSFFKPSPSASVWISHLRKCRVLEVTVKARLMVLDFEIAHAFPVVRLLRPAWTSPVTYFNQPCHLLTSTSPIARLLRPDPIFTHWTHNPKSSPSTSLPNPSRQSSLVISSSSSSSSYSFIRPSSISSLQRRWIHSTLTNYNS